MWVGQRLSPASPLYNMAFAFVFPAEIRADLFCEAWQRVVDASDALRTRVVDDESGSSRWTLGGARAAHRGDRVRFATRPRRGVSASGAAARCARPLPLGGDLVDSVLVRLGDGRTGWYLNQHHLVADAWSTHLLYGQVAAEYESLLRGDGTAAAGAARLLSDDGGPAGRDGRARSVPWNTGGRAGSDRAGRFPLRPPRGSPPARRAPASHSNSTRAVRALIDRLCGQAGLAEPVGRRVAVRAVRDAARQLAPPDQREPRTWLRRPGQRASDAAGPACARRVHRDVPLLDRREHRRHLQDAGGQVPAGIHAPAAPCAAGRQRSIGRHGRQRRPQLRARRVRDLRGAPGRGGLGAPGTRRQRACLFDSRSTTSPGRGATCCTSTSTTGRSSRDCGAAVCVTSRRCSMP
ncbi:MAG: condensation domain-containing protein [Comamonadaceae bacterium]|nr:condensation domain-containing protein [Comamonadaceae bacterium]